MKCFCCLTRSVLGLSIWGGSIPLFVSSIIFLLSMPDIWYSINYGIYLLSYFINKPIFMFWLYIYNEKYKGQQNSVKKYFGLIFFSLHYFIFGELMVYSIYINIFSDKTKIILIIVYVYDTIFFIYYILWNP